MRIKNFTSRPTPEVERLIRFACEGIAISNVSFEIRNTSRQYSGRIWYRTPLRRGRNGLYAKRERVRILIRVGRDTKFPCTNVWKHIYWKSTLLSVEQLTAQSIPFRVHTVTISGVTTHQIQAMETVEHAYGGKSSPHITYNSWREALVAVAAHEAKHLVQYRVGVPRSEVDAEAFALRKLNEFRAVPLAQAANSSAPVE